VRAADYWQAPGFCWQNAAVSPPLVVVPVLGVPAPPPVAAPVPAAGEPPVVLPALVLGAAVVV
jgi:hypothetical protein